ncbi:MAG TPA: phospholipid carrier-dependent glycosyltransferase [Candidatus Binatus sp.]|nr:phospholipid carrier-dependent glycosyltransferase [Candidatus Binatus sp.]
MSQRTAAEPKPVPRAANQGRPPANVSTTAPTGAAGTPLTRREIVNIAALCAAAFVLRLIPITLIGHAVDISTFENWMLVLGQYGPWGFYTHVQFIDYPPGYMLFLWAASGLHAVLDHIGLAAHGIDTLIISIKMPAILADVAIVYLVYLIMRRNWSTQIALGAAAIITILNPDIAFLSAYWGQADSVGAVFVVWAIYLALTDRFEFAWASLAFAILVKPHPIAIVPLLLLWQLRRQGFTWKLAAFPVASLLVAYLGTVQFTPFPSLFEGAVNATAQLPKLLALPIAIVLDFFKNPLHVLQWLYAAYAHGRDGYPYNSVNAFNLYSMKNDFWQSDLQPVTPSIFGLHLYLGPLWLWGVGIFTGFLIAFAMRQWRTTGPDVSREDAENSFIFASFLVMLGYFMLLTRMHERYIFTAVVLVTLVRPLGPIQRIATLALASTFMIDLFYGLYYLKTPSADLSPILVHSMSIINVVSFFAVSSVYLIDEFDAAVKAWFAGGAKAPRAPPRRSPQLLEGLIGFTRTDWWIVGGLTAATAFLLLYRIGAPNERIFDEIYYARSAQEYLHHQVVFESTHPPLTKLAMAATAWFFQIGLPALGAWLSAHGLAFGQFFVRNQIGDPVSSRIACALAGIATVPVLYAFAKRVFASTPAAIVSCLLLLTSGFFFVQARTALPDIFVGLFSLCSLYCGYRYFTSAQVVRRVGGSYPDWSSLAALAGVSVIIIAFVGLEVAYYDPSKSPPGPSWYAYLAFIAIMTAFCVWWALRSRREHREGDTVVYPDGSVAAAQMLEFPSGQSKPLKNATYDDGTQRVAWNNDGALATEGDASVHWQADGAVSGTHAGFEFFDKQQWGTWLVLTGLSLGAVSASKWYGLFDAFTLIVAAVLVTAQGFLPTYWRWRDTAKGDMPWRLLWGNPLSWRIPLAVAAVAVIGVVLYGATYIPYFTLGQTWQDILSSQYGMYRYHHDLVATHIYASPWWFWPLDLRPVAYYYHSFTKPTDPVQIVGEVLALPNPFVWVAGLITVPLAGWLAWCERHKGMLIVVGACFLHWLPWVGSPRIDFQYNIYNNTALVCLCSAYVLLRLWRWARATATSEPNRLFAVRLAVGAYLALCIVGFAYFYPILGAVPITYESWHEHMWLSSGCAPGQKENCIGWI